MGALARRLTNGMPITQQMTLDAQVHRSIYRAAHNRFLESTLTEHYNLATRIWHLFLKRVDAQGYVVEHTELLDAVIDGDAKLARRRAAAHVRNFEQAIRAVI